MNPVEKIEKELDHMKLNASSLKMGLVNLGPYLELNEHHITKIRKYLDQIDCYDEPHDRGGGILH